MTDLIYKPIPPSEHELFARNDSQAFTLPLAEVRDWLAHEPGGELRGLYADRRLVSQVMLFPLQISAGLTALPIGGLGAVSTPPEARRRGYVARLMREVCAELLQRDVFLSVLYPFNAAFYQQFGYALFEERKHYTGPTVALAPFRRQRAGTWEPAGAEQIATLNDVYRRALHGRFGPIVRDERWWRRQVLRLHKDDTYAYLWRDEAGNARTYCVYSYQKTGEQTTIVSREAVALDPTARAQLFAFMADQDNQCQQVSFRAPPDAPVQALLPEYFRCEVKPHFMLRLLDVGHALSAYRYPKSCSGRLTLAVTDDWLPENAGVWALELASGAAQCQRLPADTPHDLACDVRVLAQLYARYVRPRTAAAFGLLTVNSRAALALAEQLFAGLAPFSSDFF